MTAASRPTTAVPADDPAAPAAPLKPTTPPRHDQRAASNLKTSLSGKLPPAGPGGMTSRRLTADQACPPEPGKTDQSLHVAGTGPFHAMIEVCKDVSPAESCSHALCVTSAHPLRGSTCKRKHRCCEHHQLSLEAWVGRHVQTTLLFRLLGCGRCSLVGLMRHCPKSPIEWPFPPSQPPSPP